MQRHDDNYLILLWRGDKHFHIAFPVAHTVGEGRRFFHQKIPRGAYVHAHLHLQYLHSESLALSLHFRIVWGAMPWHTKAVHKIATRYGNNCNRHKASHKENIKHHLPVCRVLGESLEILLEIRFSSSKIFLTSALSIDLSSSLLATWLILSCVH